ncbi:hypothetical protein PMAYCL1PPCAC_28526, partial [Pristionchus mayeri]
LTGSFLSQNFETRCKLGEGDFGIVHEVQCMSSDTKYAIKISKVNPLKARNGLNYSRTNLNEVRAHMSIPPHDNLVRFHRAWKEQGHVYMQIELCKESLLDYWKTSTQLTQKELSIVLHDSLRALSYLALHNFIHLDIKPANILRTEKGVYKLADFSVTLDLNKDSSSDDIGSGRYAAPELFTDKIFSPKADLFSLAISLFQVAVPADAPLNDEEWRELKQGRIPNRAEKALTGDLGRKVRSMLREFPYRPSAVELLGRKDIESTLAVLQKHEKKFQNNRLRGRQSMSSAVERELRGNASPLVHPQKCGVIFHTDEVFFTMERPMR